MAITGLAKKLMIKPGYRMIISNPTEGFIDELGDLPEGAVILNESAEDCDYVLVFANNSNELKQAGRTFLEALAYDGVFWLAYPKKSSKIQTDLSRDRGYEILSKAGLRPVSLVSIDEKWSALRFRPMERVK